MVELTPRSDFLSDKPNVARIYDYFLGGFSNFAADRVAAEQLKALDPDIPAIMRANRAFLRRAVQFLSEAGIAQFLDIGSGIPTVGNVHEIAQELNPNARVIYVDIDPVAIAYSRSILQGNAQATAIQADARDPEAILAHPEVNSLLDLNQPVATLLVAVLHFIRDDAEAAHTVATLRDCVVPGSYLVISHGTFQGAPRRLRERGERVSAQTTSPGKPRTYDQIARFFDGLALVEPGLVHVPRWRPESPDDLFLKEPERSLNFGAVARKPQLQRG